MSAWMFLSVLCLSVSAQVVETVRVPVASVPGAVGAAAGAAAAIPSVPQASVLAPSLGSSIGMPQSFTRFAPPAAAPASPAVEAAARAEPAHARTSTKKDIVPPSTPGTGRTIPMAASFQGRDSVGAAPLSISEQSEAAARFSARTAPGEGAAAMGQQIWDLSSEHAGLEETAIVPSAPHPDSAAYVRAPAFSAVVEPRSGRSGAAQDRIFEPEVLRDAVASPAVLPGGAFFPRSGALATAPLTARQTPASDAGAQTPITPQASRPSASLNRLWLELSSGLVVKVRAALGFSTSAQAPEAVLPLASSLPRAEPATGAPLTSTEWLERRGLLETLSASESVAGDVSSTIRAMKSSPITPQVFAASVPPMPAAPSAPASLPSVLWGLLFLPAAALLKDLL